MEPETVSSPKAAMSKCPVCGGDMHEGDSKHYDAERDADTLTDSQTIREDKNRHTMAKAHLDHKAKVATKAASMEDKAKAGLAAAFPGAKDGD